MSEDVDLYQQSTTELHVTESKTVVEPVIHYLEFAASGPQGPQGPPGSPGGSRYIHTQSTPSNAWVVDHNLGYEPLFATVVVNDKDVTDSVDIEHLTVNKLVVTFSPDAKSGKAAFL